MKKAFKITIPEPCHEDWEKMTPTQKGKHCAVCETEVIDFSSKSNEQLYKLIASGTNMCGRFRKEQLDKEIRLPRKEKHSIAGYAASLLLPATLLITQQTTAKQGKPQTEQTTNTYRSLGIGVLSQKQTQKKNLSLQTSITIKGNISDQTGPLPGVNVYVKGAENGIQSDFDGNFEITLLVDDVLIFSYIGYKTQEITIRQPQKLNIILEEDENNLLGAIVVGGFVTEPFTSVKPKIHPYAQSDERAQEEKERKEHLQKVKAYKKFKRQQKKAARITKRLKRQQEKAQQKKKERP